MQLARQGLAAFCHPRRSGSAWIAGLDPFLTLQTASAYATVDPARVPCSRVFGAPAPQGGDAFSQVVSVLTDAGRYRVLLSRASTSGAWRISQFIREGTR